MQRLLFGILGIALLALSLFFGGVALLVARSEVWPAVQAGSLNVESSTQILNVWWEGNEIYFLLLAYASLAIAFAFGAIRALNAAIRPDLK